MKTRLIVAAIGLPIMVVAALLAPGVIVAALVALISLAAVFEYGKAVGGIRYPVPAAASLLFAAAVPMWAAYGERKLLLLMGTLLYGVIIMGWLMARNGKVAFSDFAPFFLGALLIPFALSTLVTLFFMGREYLLLPFVIAFASDAGAYFVGSAIGKHRITPVISPNKTAEGVIGGILGSAAVTALYCILMLILGRGILWIGIPIYGVLGSTVSQFGDLVFSYIKRQYNIKDYGRILPGHGGLLDRLDSVVFCAPFTQMMLLALPLFVIK